MKMIEIKQKLVEEALNQLKAAQQDSYVQSTQNVIDELELALRKPPVVGRSELLLDFVRWQNRQSKFITIPETMVTDYEKYLEYVGGKKQVIG